MRDLLKFLLSQIVDQPEQVKIDQTSDETGTIILTAAVAPEDMGKVIGRGGKIISAIRELLKVKAVKANQRVRLILAEPATETNSLSPAETAAESPDKS